MIDIMFIDSLETEEGGDCITPKCDAG